MNKALAAFVLLLAALPAATAAQEYEVTRRSWTFLDNRLTVRVTADAPGELHIIRGERGRVEVAARSDDGFPGFGLGGAPFHELRLTAPGAERVRYLVVVPDYVSVSVQLPGQQGSRSVSFSGGTYEWGEDDRRAVLEPIQPTTTSGLYVAIDRIWAPQSVDVPDLAAVRSLAVRVEGGSFRVAASRPLAVTSGDRSRVEVRAGGEPVDLVVYLPAGTASFELRSGGERLVTVVNGRPQSDCRGVTVQTPTPSQRWLTVHPLRGAVECR